MCTRDDHWKVCSVALSLLASVFVLWRCAQGQTFKRRDGSETVEGRLLGKVTLEGKRFYLVRTASGMRRLPQDQWTTKGPRRPEPATGEESDQPKPGAARRPDRDQAWPGKGIVYGGRRRSAEWLEKAWRALGKQIVVCEGVAVNRHEVIAVPTDVAGVPRDRRQRAVGEAFHARVRVGSIRGERSLVGRLQNGQAVLVEEIDTAELLDGQDINMTLVGVETWKDASNNTILRCRRMPEEPARPRRQDFVKALRDGVALYMRWRRCPRCQGSGYVTSLIAPGVSKTVTRPCPRCGGLGGVGVNLGDGGR